MGRGASIKKGRRMYEITVQRHFSAAHHLAGYEGNCARWHGHNCDVTVFLLAEELNELGIAVDFRIVKSSLDRILEELDHADLNQVPGFTDRNPTSENIARYVFEKLTHGLAGEGVEVAKVRVSETPGTSASFFKRR